MPKRPREEDFHDRATVIANIERYEPLTREELELLRRTKAVDLTWRRLFRKLFRRPLLWMLKQLR